MQTYYTGDLHFGHKNIHKYRPIVESSAHNTEFMLHKLSLLGKRDILWVLGDFIFDHNDYRYVTTSIKQMPFRLNIVMGNHDSRLLYHDFQSSIQLPLLSHKNRWISHCPIHPDELRGRDGNIHGHLHHGSLPDPRYYNVNIDVSNYEFVPIETINAYYKDLNDE